MTDEETHVEKHGLPRRDFLKTSVAAGAAAAFSWTNRVRAADDVGPEVPPRFTLPAGVELGFKWSQRQAVKGGSFMRWGVNKPIGAENGAQIVLGNGNATAFLGARLVDQNAHFVDDELMLGATKVPGVEAGSAMIALMIEPGQNFQLLNMPGTIIVSEEKGVEPPRKRGYTNNSEKPQQVVLVVPPAERDMRVGNVARALDIENLRKGILLYKGTTSAQGKTKIYEALEPMVWNTIVNMRKDAGIEQEPESLRRLYKKIIAPDTSEDSKERTKNKKEYLEERFDNLMENRENADGERIYSDDEVRLLFKGGPKPTDRPLLLDFVESVVAPQQKLGSDKGR